MHLNNQIYNIDSKQSEVIEVFQTDINEFMDSFLWISEPYLKKYTLPYTTWIKERNSGEFNTAEEHFMNMVMAGLYWHLHITDAISTPKVLLLPVKRLAYKKGHNILIKFILKLIQTNILNRSLHQMTKPVHTKYTAGNFSILQDWLVATNEFADKVTGIKHLYNYICTLNEKEVADLLENTHIIGSVFLDMANRFSDKYPSGIEELTGMLTTHKFRENTYVIHGKYKAEYLLDAISGMIKNNASATPDKYDAQKVYSFVNQRAS